MFVLRRNLYQTYVCALLATQSGSCFDPLHKKKELLLVRALIIEFARQEKVVHPRMYKFVIVEW